MLSAAAWAQDVNSIDVTARVSADGSAHITQVWDAVVSSGTEFYEPIGNLGPMKIGNLQVSENSQAYISEGTGWDVNRSLAQKAGRCGIVKKSDGVELCWGQGSYGPHVWNVQFDAYGLVQSLEDYDGFNFMFVNPGIAPISRVNVTIENATGGPEWTADNVKVWAFGFDGYVEVRDGKIFCHNSSALSKSNKVIILARFDKGLLSPAVSRDYDFGKLQKKAFKGSDYSDDGDGGLFAAIIGLLFFVPLLALLVWFVIQKATGRVDSKKIYGVNKVTGWWREPPLDGNLFASYYIYEKGNRFPGTEWPHGKDLVGACFLKWVLEKKVIPVKADDKGKRYNLQFSPGAMFEDASEGALYNMALEAAGENLILETGEFERWSKRKYEKIMNWPGRAAASGCKYLQEQGLLSSAGRTTEEGQEKARQVLQFKNFLNDFTLNDERGVPEVTLWNDYLVFAQMYGIADQVASQLKKLYPADFDHYARSLDIEPAYLPRIITLNRSLANNAYANAAAKMSSVRSSGGGGFSSVGGGGGFSGGGFGGGSR